MRNFSLPLTLPLTEFIWEPLIDSLWALTIEASDGNLFLTRLFHKFACRSASSSYYSVNRVSKVSESSPSPSVLRCDIKDAPLPLLVLRDRIN
jgi:hypothetical protein